MRIIECVPNFSEGQNKETFQAIIEAIKKTEGVKFLNLEPDADYNRVVVTMAGNEKGIIDGAVNACKAASDLIDMRTHKGEHPRIGATDVCPLIPLYNITMEETVEAARNLAGRVGSELNIQL